jgi:gliding motility-associated-like protein
MTVPFGNLKADMKSLSIVSLWIISNSLLAQNLVANYSFEDLSSCPTELSQVSNAIPWTAAQENITFASSDLFNVCGIPKLTPTQSEFGKQEPKHGDGYAGIWTFLGNYTNVQPSQTPYREYIETSLTEKLIAGKKYCVDFYVSLAEYSWGGIQDIGALVSVGSINQGNYSTDPNYLPNIPLKPQITNENGSNLVDTVNWIQIKGSFIAKGNEDHITIGNFNNDGDTSYQPLLTSMDIGLAYYYIDMVTLTECEESCNVGQVKLPDDTVLCQDDSLTIHFAPEVGYKYQWQDGSSSPTYVISSPGLYWVDKYKYECHSRDSILIGREDYLNLADNDTTSCNGTSVTLSFDAKGRSVLWNTGATENSIIVNTTGLYTAEIDGEGCKESMEIMVHFYDCLDFLPNVITPNNDPHNEYFVVEGMDKDKWLLKIFNRYGTEVYANYDYDNSWNGKGLSAGVYYFYLLNQNSNKSFRGWVQVIFEEK